MKNNYLYIIVIVGYIIFSGCGKDRNYTDLINYKIINQTNYDLYCEIINETMDSTETRSSFINPNDSVDILFSNTKIVSYPRRLYYYAYMSFNIYNLNDTTKITQPKLSFPEFIDNGWLFYNNEDKLEYYIKVDSKNDGRLGSYRLFIDTNKLYLFEKDYSMLEKFPEYYGN